MCLVFTLKFNHMILTAPYFYWRRDYWNQMLRRFAFRLNRINQNSLIIQKERTNHRLGLELRLNNTRNLMNESEAVWCRSRTVQTAAAVVDELLFYSEKGNARQLTDRLCCDLRETPTRQSKLTAKPQQSAKRLMEGKVTAKLTRLWTSVVWRRHHFLRFFRHPQRYSPQLLPWSFSPSA